VSRRVQDLYLGKSEEKKRMITTPEGVDIRVVVADAGSRCGAIIIYLMIIFATMLVVALVVNLTAGAGELDGWRMAIVQIFAFLLVNFYFIFFELKWQGRTPGKRAIGIRVIDASGGYLRPEAIFARNLVRDVELFVPMAVLISPEQISNSSSGLVRAFSIIWALGLLFWPIFNKDRKRVGDMVGGTLVVLAPKTALLSDVAEGTAAAQSLRMTAQRPRREAVYSFTDDQLDIYGEYELQVLENVLRGSDSMEHQAALETVYTKIRRKIRYDDLSRSEDAEQFLRDFYAALRARLEKKRLFGKRKRDKFSGDEE